MSVASKLLLLKQKIQNNIDAVIERNTYSGNKVDVKSDILAIESKPRGQVITGMRRPTEIEKTGNNWVVPTENTILDTGEGIVKQTNIQMNPLPITVNGEEIGSVSCITNKKHTFYLITAYSNEIMLGTESDCIKLKGYSYADFHINESTLTEIYITTQINPANPAGIEIERVLVRYINP